MHPAKELDPLRKALRAFSEYAQRLRGDEKGEAQVFLDRLFRAFGHEGYHEAGAVMEGRLRRKGKAVAYADLRWSNRVLIEMKRRGEDLDKHYEQLQEYWLRAVPYRPKLAVLCNFDELYIYDLNIQLDEPVERVSVAELADRLDAVTFMLPEPREPRFSNNRVEATREAAAKLARVYQQLIGRGETAERAQRFVLQCLVGLFAQSIDLLPHGFFHAHIEDCLAERGSTYDLFGALFRQMGDPVPARAGRYISVRYFHGGLFKTVDPVALGREELEALQAASALNWARVQPAIFGAIFEESMDRPERHAYGAHYTSEQDIQSIIMPTLVAPFKRRLSAATSARDLLALRDNLRQINVLDPACGSGNFLYVAFRELKRLETAVTIRLHDEFAELTRARAGVSSRVSATQFWGIDRKPFAVELARVTLMIAKKLAVDEANRSLGDLKGQLELAERDLPFDDLDQNIREGDALFMPWRQVDVIVGNPPFVAKNKMVPELGRGYVDGLRAAFPDISGRADYCVYFFRKAHDALAIGGRAGLIGTNTIRQNDSRAGGLDYIVQNGGQITDAVATMVWPGEAVVHVSVVNWVKGDVAEPRVLARQLGDDPEGPWERVEVEQIGASLSERDMTGATTLACNQRPKRFFQGQTHGCKGFLLNSEEAAVLGRSEGAREWLFPYLVGDDLLGVGRPTRFAIDVSALDDERAVKRYKGLYRRLVDEVLPEVRRKAAENPLDTQRQAHLATWWKFWRPRPELLERLRGMARYIVCVRVTRRPIFAFIDASIRPNDALQAFAFDDDYSFGVLQSRLHWEWFVERCSTLKGDFRYTSETVWSSFPWPQEPAPAVVREVAEAARELRAVRAACVREQGSLRAVYRALERPGRNMLRDSQNALDRAVRRAYGLHHRTDVLMALLRLNAEVAAAEQAGRAVQGPGVPEALRGDKGLRSRDRVTCVAPWAE